jgi:hypothetical protein
LTTTTTRRKTPADDVRAFRARHGLTQAALNRLLGFVSNDAAVGRWERVGAPYYATLLFKLVDEHGIGLMKEIAEKGDWATPRHEVQKFRERHKLTGEQLDRLFGLYSRGRATRRWEDPLERGAPSYITIMMAYCTKYGCDSLMSELDASTGRR